MVYAYIMKHCTLVQVISERLGLCYATVSRAVKQEYKRGPAECSNVKLDPIGAGHDNKYLLL